MEIKEYFEKEINKIIQIDDTQEKDIIMYEKIDGIITMTMNSKSKILYDYIKCISPVVIRIINLNQ
jgi:hypothetical protein